MDREAMSNEENYCFDVGGYLMVRGALSRQEVDALNRALDSSTQTEGMLGWPAPHRDLFRDLLVHPLLVWYLNQLVGYGFRLDRQPELLGVGVSAEAVGKPLVGGNEPRNPARAYYHQNGRRYCQAVQAIWTLSDVDEGDGGFVMVPGSHKSGVEAPEDIATGKDDMGLTFQPALEAGDLVLVAGSVLQGLRPWKGKGPQRLLSYEYIGRGAIQSAGTGPGTEGDGSDEWMAELTPEQRTVLHRPGYENTVPPPTLATDGEAVWIEDQFIHPSLYIKDPNTTIDEKEFYFWDLCGYLVVRNVMDEAWLAAANEVVDKFEDQIVVGTDLSRGSKSLRGPGGPTLGDLYRLTEPYCEPFRKMVGHPAVVHRMNWMGASGFRCGAATAFCSVQGGTGHSLHGGNDPLSPSAIYICQNGRSYCERVTLTWQLRDVPAGQGGFACVPGSHKAFYPMPDGVRTCDEPMGLVAQPEMRAGDLLFFMDGPQSHGALAWKNPIPRRCILILYESRSFHRTGGELTTPEGRWGDLLEGMSDAQMAEMRGPDRDVQDLNVPRLLVEDGKVAVSYERGQTLYSRETPTRPVGKEK